MAKIDQVIDFRHARKPEPDLSERIRSTMSVETGPTDAAMAALREHPRFGEAFDRVFDGLYRHFRGNWILNRVFNDRGRVMMGLLVLDLHYNGVDDQDLTASRLKRVCTDVELCSPGRVTAMLGVMRLFGFLEEAPTADRRVRRLVPTEKMLRAHRVRWRCFFEALALLIPEGKAALARLEDTRFVAGQLGVMAAMCRSGMRVEDHVPELVGVFGRDSGIMMLLTLAAAAPDVRPGAPVELDMTVSGLAKRFSVSRGHVRLVLRECERTGLVERCGPNGHGIAVTAAARDAAERFVAASLLFHAVSARAGLTAIEDADGQNTGAATAHG